MRDLIQKIDRILIESVEEDNGLFQIGDEFGISFSEDLEIATTIVGFVEDGIVVELDDTAVGILESNGARFVEGYLEEGLRDPKDNPCWKGYKPVGTKKKNGRTVPNCVPKESIEEAAGLYGPFTVTIQTGERPTSRTKTKKFKREDDAILWAEDWLEDSPQYPFATAEVTDPDGNVVWTTDESVVEGYTGADDTDTVGFHLDSERAYQAVMDRFGHLIDHDETSGIMYAPARVWPQIEMVAFDADGVGAQRDDDLENPEHYGVAEGLGKDIKRGLQGWGSPQDKPADIVKRNKAYDVDTAKKLRATIGNPDKHSPQGLQKRVLDRKLKGVAEGKKHTSPSGVETNMDPSDDDYAINYGKNGGVAKFRKSQGLDVKTGEKKVKEETQDPNLYKAYRMGNAAYKAGNKDALKTIPQQYKAMWIKGWEDGERFAKESIDEAEYQGRKVTLNKPTPNTDGKSKTKVYVRDPKTGNVKKVTFGDPNMRIKKSNPERRKSFRARHNCSNPGPKTKARYWSCRAW